MEVLGTVLELCLMQVLGTVLIVAQLGILWHEDLLLVTQNFDIHCLCIFWTI